MSASPWKRPNSPRALLRAKGNGHIFTLSHRARTLGPANPHLGSELVPEIRTLVRWIGRQVKVAVSEQRN